LQGGTLLTSMWNLTNSHVGHDSFTCDMWDMTHSSETRDENGLYTCLTRTHEMTHSYEGHAWFIRGTWLIHIWDMTNSHVICGTWLIHQRRAMKMDCTRVWFVHIESRIHMRDMPHSYMGYDSFIYGTWLIHMWDMTHSYMGHDSLIRGTWLIHQMTRDENGLYTCRWTAEYASNIKVHTHKHTHIHTLFLRYTKCIFDRNQGSFHVRIDFRIRN